MKYEKFIELVGENLPSWIGCLLYSSLDFDFIQEKELLKALKILEKSGCNNRDEFFDENHDSDDRLVKSLTDATQL